MSKFNNLISAFTFRFLQKTLRKKMNQPKLFLFMGIIVASMSACRTQYASFQPMPQENFSTHKASVEKPKHEEMWQVEPIENKKIETIDNNPTIQPETWKEVEESKIGEERAVLQVKKPKKPIFATKRFNLVKTYHQATKKFEEKSRRRDGPFWWFNERIKIGLILLGVAILLGILSLQSLATLFGVAAIIFIAWGLAKVF